MREIALHILDLAQNSLLAGAEKLEIEVVENIPEDLFSVEIKDDGDGLDQDLLENVSDPFVTTRSSRKVGMGIPLFKAACERCDGAFDINSSKGVGTRILGQFVHSHIDRMPLGNIAGVMAALISGYPGVRFIYQHRVNEKKFVFDTLEIVEKLEGIPPGNPRVARWIESYIDDSVKNLRKNQ